MTIVPSHNQGCLGKIFLHHARKTRPADQHPCCVLPPSYCCPLAPPRCLPTLFESCSGYVYVRPTLPRYWRALFSRLVHKRCLLQHLHATRRPNIRPPFRCFFFPPYNPLWRISQPLDNRLRGLSKIYYGTSQALSVAGLRLAVPRTRLCAASHHPGPVRRYTRQLQCTYGLLGEVCDGEPPSCENGSQCCQ